MKKRDKRKIYCVRFSTMDNLYYVVQGGVPFEWALTFNEATSIADSLNKTLRLNARKEPRHGTPSHSHNRL